LGLSYSILVFEQRRVFAGTNDFLALIAVMAVELQKSGINIFYLSYPPTVS
jgi:hypothetical protein